MASDFNRVKMTAKFGSCIIRINYDSSDLEAFLAAKENSSFHLAADKLSLSLAAISRRIKKLEETFAAQLFERTTRAIKSSLAAKQLQSRAEAILDEAREITHTMGDESTPLVQQNIDDSYRAHILTQPATTPSPN